MLAGFRSGWAGTVAPQDTWWGGEEFCVRFDHDPPSVLQRVLLRHDQFVSVPLNVLPGWLPPLATDDLALVDEFVVRFCGALFQGGAWRWQDEELFAVVLMSWRRRLPMRPIEAWAACAAHGMPQRFKSRFLRGFEFGSNLLVWSQGRPPIKRRRIPAMSIPRYEPSRRQRNVGPIAKT